MQVEPKTIGFARASCDITEVLTGGGFSIQDAGERNPTVFSARDPDDPNSWLVQLTNHDAVEVVIIQAFAECASQ
ncbi:MAG: hypothetical protein WBL68_08105 [Nitrososphaeraceae archaeon]